MMKKGTAVMSGVFAIAFGLGAAGCNSGSNPAPAHINAQRTPAWELTLNSKCSTADAENCSAAYGFSVTADGDYIVGPGPQGQTVKGKLSADEFRKISDLVTGVKVEGGETCIQSEAAADDETLVFTRNHKKSTVLHHANTDLCYRAQTADGAESLHDAMSDLANRYYPSPFPDDCLDAATAYEATYAASQRCATNADCAYLTDTFDPIPQGDVEYVTTDNCAKVKPMVVGNISAVANHQNELLAGLDHVRTVCGQRLIRPDCSQFAGFQSSDAPPVCKAGSCQVNPSLAH